MGTGRPVHIGESFDGLGVGFTGPHGTSAQRNPPDSSIAVGRDHIMQTVSTRVAIFIKVRRGRRALVRVPCRPRPRDHAAEAVLVRDARVSAIAHAGAQRAAPISRRSVSRCRCR